jgi:hypothetical protein
MADVAVAVNRKYIVQQAVSKATAGLVRVTALVTALVMDLVTALVTDLVTVTWHGAGHGSDHGTGHGCTSMWAHQPGAGTSMEVTGQSGQSKLHTVVKHLPGGHATAEPDDSDVRRACSYTALRPGMARDRRRSRPWDGRQARARNRRRRPGSDSEGRESTKCKTGTTCLAASLTCVHEGP